MDWLLFIALNVAGLVLLAALVAWRRLGVQAAPPMSPWLPLVAMGMAGGLAVASILAGEILIAIAAAMNLAVLAMLFWQARRLRSR